MSNSMEYVSRFRALAEILERIGANINWEDGEPKVRPGIQVYGEDVSKIYFLYRDRDWETYSIELLI